MLSYGNDLFENSAQVGLRFHDLHDLQDLHDFQDFQDFHGFHGFHAHLELARTPRHLNKQKAPRLPVLGVTEGLI